MIKDILTVLISLLITSGIAAVSDSSHKLIIIAVDGMGGQYTDQTPTPFLDQIAENGAHTIDMQNVLPVLSGPNWAAMLTGSYPSVNKVTNNYNLKRNAVETVFTAYRKKYPKGTMWAIYEWSKLEHLLKESDNFQINKSVKNGRAVPKAIGYMKRKKYQPDFLFLHLDFVDHAGHIRKGGWGSMLYLNAVTKADSQIGDLINAVEKYGSPDETIFIVTADHGGFEKVHYNKKGGGWDNYVTRSVPFYIKGPTIKEGHKITEYVRIWDVASTAARIFNLDLPKDWVSQPVSSAFKDEDKTPAENPVLYGAISTNDYSEIYNNKDTGAVTELSFWEPKIKNKSVYYITQTAVTHYNQPKTESIVFSEDDSLVLKKPIGYELISLFKKKRENGHEEKPPTVLYWRPIPPAGFTCVSDIATIYDTENFDPKTFDPYEIPQPVKPYFRCIKTSLLKKGEFNKIWTDVKSEGEFDITVWNGIDSDSDIPTYGFRVRRSSYKFDFGYNIFYNLKKQSH